MKQKFIFVFAIMAIFPLGFTGAVVLAAESSTTSHFTVTPLSEGLLLITGPTGNTIVDVETDGLILIDGVPEEYAQEYLEFVYQQSGITDVIALFNSNWHSEITGLNQILGEQGVKIIAHENTKQWLGTTIRKDGDEIIHTPYADAALPNDTIYTEASLANIDYGYLLQAHTDGDIYLKFKDANVLFTGSMVRSDRWPVLDITTGGFIGGMLDAYQVLLEQTNADTIIVPASGAVMSQAELRVQYSMYKSVMTGLVASLRASMSPAEAVAAEPARGYYPQWGAPDQFLEQAFRSFYGHLRNGRHVGVMP